MKNRLFIIGFIVFSILLIPLIAMQFTSEVNWSLIDFVVGAMLLFSCGIAIDYVIRKVKSNPYRIALTLSILAILLLVWAELAVGILGTPLSGS